MTPDRGANALVSVLMPCCGMLEYTRLSVPRVLRHSRPPFEVVFIDAGSLDGTADYLAGVADAAGASGVRVEVVRGEREADFAGMVEDAVRRARGAFVAWMNNDVLVPEFWLQQLLGLATSNEVIGVVGPMSNLAPEKQRVPCVSYRLGKPKPGGTLGGIRAGRVDAEVDRFAREFREAGKGQWGEADHVAGFCWLARRGVLERVPLLEKGGEEAVVDASRFSVRVRQAGFRLACCRDLYVHHFGGNLMTDESVRK